MVKPLHFWSYGALHQLNRVLVIGSVACCTLLQPHRLLGMTLLDVSPNWLLIWVVTWSVRRPPLQGAIAGIALGWIQDAITAPHPTHAIGLAMVGCLTSSLDKQRFIEEDFISAALLVFVMAILVEGILAAQIAMRGEWPLPQIWMHLQHVSLSSAIISSLWTPLVYVPLNRWWERLQILTDR